MARAQGSWSSSRAAPGAAGAASTPRPIPSTQKNWQARAQKSRIGTEVDVLIDGPYDASRPERTLLARGSTNQRFHFLTGRYSPDDFIMPGRAEVFIGADGTVRETGFSRVARKAL